MAAVAIIVVEFPTCGLLRVEAEFGVGLAALDIAAGEREKGEYHHGNAEARKNEARRNPVQEVHDYCRRSRIIRKA
jgi:hypothetical protein